MLLLLLTVARRQAETMTQGDMEEMGFQRRDWVKVLGRGESSIPERLFSNVPESPGVYMVLIQGAGRNLMRHFEHAATVNAGQIEESSSRWIPIYVGKAANLQKRLQSYHVRRHFLLSTNAMSIKFWAVRKILAQKRYAIRVLYLQLHSNDDAITKEKNILDRFDFPLNSVHNGIEGQVLGYRDILKPNGQVLMHLPWLQLLCSHIFGERPEICNRIDQSSFNHDSPFRPAAPAAAAAGARMMTPLAGPQQRSLQVPNAAVAAFSPAGVLTVGGREQHEELKVLTVNDQVVFNRLVEEENRQDADEALFEEM